MVDFKKTPMTKEQAEQVRIWRINASCTFQSIALMANSRWPKLNISLYSRGQNYANIGMDLCLEAAEFFGENAVDEPWN